MSAKYWGLMAILSILWGGSFLFVEVALRGFPVLSIVWLRVAGAAGLLALWAWGTGAGFPKGARAWRALFGMGVLTNAVPFTLFVLAQGQIEGGLAAILNATTPLWTVLVAQMLTTDARLTRPQALGLCLGFAGVVVIAGGARAEAGQIWAILACLGAALSYGFGGVWGRQFKTLGLAPGQVAFGMLASSAMMIAPFWLAIDQPWAMPAPPLVPALAVLGLSGLSTALAYLIYFRILAQAGPMMLSLVTFLIPPSALIMGVWLLGEVILARHFIGLALILLGLVALDGRVFGRKQNG